MDIESQYGEAGKLRILVCGAGVAGVTVAQMLRRQGMTVVLVERASEALSAGYMLALMPMADAAIDGLGVRERYRNASIPIRRYAVDGHTGRRLREDPIESVVSSFGDYRGIDRGSLVDVLSGDGAPVTLGASVRGIADRGDVVEATLGGGVSATTHEFDAVIVAEGMHSRTRDLLGRAVRGVDTGWGGWVVWTDVDDAPDVGEELWGAGCFAATYPVAGKLGVFLGGPRTDTAGGPTAFVERMRAQLQAATPRIERAMAAVAEAPDPYFWALRDIRARRWAVGRTVLLGDAASGFLPTAGIGAGMAMESAWLLAQMLRDADRGEVATVLRRFERLQRPRVTSAQRNSRMLAALMFRRSRVLAAAREAALRTVSVDRALGPIRKLLETPVRGT